MKGLYFIAIVPPNDLANRIHQLRIELSDKYHCYDALKPPVHLTLKEPFTMDIKEELILKRKLSFIATQVQPFLHQLKDFDRYQKFNIYIKAEKHKELTRLQTNIKKMFRSIFYHVQQDQFPFNPHYTIAYRDIKAELFEKAFADYETRRFEAHFTCNRFILFRHDKIKWHSIEEFTLCGVPELTLFESLSAPSKISHIKNNLSLQEIYR